VKLFTILYSELDHATRAADKLLALNRYFETAPPEDAAWGLHLLLRRPTGRAVSTRLLKTWTSERAAVPLWLLESSFAAVGDLSETLALLILDPRQPVPAHPLRWWVEQRLLPLGMADDEQKRVIVEQAWDELEQEERIVWHKLITGTFRTRVHRNLVERALAEFAGVPQAVIAGRLGSDWTPDSGGFLSLIAPAPEIGGEGSASDDLAVMQSEDVEAVAGNPALGVSVVLMYSHTPRGSQAGAAAEYTFGAWHDGQLVPVAKTSSGLSDAERRRIDRFVRQNTTERFGPVRNVAAAVVVDLYFEAVLESARHKAGLVLKSPRVGRIRDDKRADEADSTEILRSLIISDR